MSITQLSKKDEAFMWNRHVLGREAESEGRASVLHLRETLVPSNPKQPVPLPPYSKGPLGSTSWPHNLVPDIILPKAESQDGVLFLF